MASRSNEVWKLCDKYHLVFAEFPGHRFMVYRSHWCKTDVEVFGLLIKQDGVWVFRPRPSFVRSFYGSTRVRAVYSYLRDLEECKEV